jgi:site-specific recombinase XerD
MSQFDKSFDKALSRVESRINMQIQRGRDAAMNPHSLRHFYAQALKELGVDSKIIQKCLHQRTINAQEAYTGVSAQKVRETLNKYAIGNSLDSKIQISGN